jgi:hypothetical protein
MLLATVADAHKAQEELEQRVPLSLGGSRHCVSIAIAHCRFRHQYHEACRAVIGCQSIGFPRKERS